MILRVILKNFLSFNDEVQFDMFPNMKRTSLSGHISMLNGKLPVLKSTKTKTAKWRSAVPA